MDQPTIYSETVRERVEGVWRLAFGVWRSAFGVWRSAFGETARGRMGETAQNRRGRFAERTILSARRVFRPTDSSPT
jgi:hypothetical protein